MQKLLIGLILAAPLALLAPLAPLAPPAPPAPPTPVSQIATAGRPSYDAVFTNETMRVDYFHRGGPSGESVTLDRVVRDGEWPGSRTRLLDDMDLGAYLFEVVEPATGVVLYSRGFGSIYGEWATTPEFRARNRTFHESVRLPWPRTRVRIVLKKRDGRNRFEPFGSFDVDPAAGKAERAAHPQAVVRTLVDGGAADRNVDLLLIAEGYSTRERAKFDREAARLVAALFALEPFKSRKGDFTVRSLHIPGKPLSVETNVLGIERYALTYDNRTLRDVAALAPYDVIKIVVNEDDYRGGGIFNFQGTVAAGHRRADYLFIHEFAHNFAGLGDEYVGNVTYETGIPAKAEPWEPNITALLDVSSLKWRDLVEPGTPLPTPMTFAGKVGAFEGAGYEARGLYRPEADCIMFSRTMRFCRVCQRAIARIIDSHTD